MTIIVRIRLLGLILLLILSPVTMWRRTAKAQSEIPACSDSSPGSNSLAWRHRANRCEGLVTLPRSKPDLQLLSFYRVLQDFDSTPNAQLKVEFYTAAQRSGVVLARDLDDQTQYRMVSDKKVFQAGWNDFGPWPVNDVIYPADIKHDNLGILVQLDGTGTPMSRCGNNLRYAPPIIHFSSISSATSKYTVIVRAGWPQKKISCTIFRWDHGSEEPIGSSSRLNVSANQIVDFIIDSTHFPETELLLRIEGENRNRIGKPCEDYVFDHRTYAPK